MLDFSHIPKSGKADIQVFNANSTLTSFTYNTWVKPRGISFVRFFGFGGGGGGGAGAAAGGLALSAGGGGGGSGCQFNIIVPAFFLPDVLYISVGYGGAGGVAGAGGAGIGTGIFTTATNIVNTAIMSAPPGNGGGAGSGATAGFASPASGVNTITANYLAGLGFIGAGIAAPGNTCLSGQGGTVGGTTVQGTNIILPTTGLVITGGAGGGGVNGTSGTLIAGGGFTTPASPAFFPIHNGGVATNTAGGRNGSNGFKLPNLQYYYGGTGGGSYAAGTGGGGGDGGAGGLGCGGGGGGGSFTGSTPQSQGGRGGDGLVIATAW